MSKAGSLMMAEINEIPQMLDNISNFLLKTDLAHELTERHEFDSVIILARGTSDNAAHYLKFLLEIELGLPVGLASPSAATMYSTKFRYDRCLLIAISQSGQSLDLLTFAKAAKNGGGYLLSITNDESSPLAQLSDLHLPLLAGPELAVPATKSFVGQIMLSYLLVMSWVGKKVDFAKVKESIKEILEDKVAYKGFAEQIDIKKPIYVLGRGISYPNAKEFALKLQETCLIPVQGMSSSDFLHGPIASINSDAQVIFMAPHHLPADSFGEAPAKVRSITGRVYWIGNPNKTEGQDVVFKTPLTDTEVTGCISDAVVFQKITHQLAIANGLNPDSPKGLSKVTITR